MAEDTLHYRTLTASAGWRNPISGTGRVGFINLAKDYAALNRKNMRHTDNKGYPLAYVVEVEAQGDASNAHTVEIYTAPENWVLKNAVRKWHFARNAMLERNSSLGKVGEYGKTIRPYLSIAHAKMDEQTQDAVPTLYTNGNDTTFSGASTYIEENTASAAANSMARGEWTYTRVANEAEYDSSEGTGNMSASGPPVDTYALCLTGHHDNSEGTEGSSMRMFTHVSMMRAYLESRRSPISGLNNPSDGGTIQKEPSPLLNLITDSMSAAEAREIIEDIQREKPPYDVFGATADNALSGNDALNLVSKCFLSTSTTYLKDKEVIRVPLGLMHVRTSASAAIGSGDTPGIRFRLLGIDKCQG